MEVAATTIQAWATHLDVKPQSIDAVALRSKLGEGTIPGPAPEPDAVIAHCRALLATYKCPKQVFVVTELPRNAMGKIVRSSLSAPV